MTFCCSARPDFSLPFQGPANPNLPQENSGVRTQNPEPRTQNREKPREKPRSETPKLAPSPNPLLLPILEPEICVPYLQEHLIHLLHLLHLLHLFTSNSFLPTDLSSAYRNSTYSLPISQHVRQRARPRMEAFEGQTAVYHGSILFSGIE
jgi:hypothetical protein